MPRLAASLAFGIVASTGCVSMDVTLSPKPLGGAPIQTPDPSKMSPASLQSAERVQLLGQRIIEQNTFTGISPLFHTISVPEPMLFHRGPEELFLSEGLVNRCKSDDELAAVLCTELGRMMADKRSAKNLGVDLGSVREIAGTTPSAIGEGQVASVVTVVESTPSMPPKNVEKPSAERLAEELLRGAGFDAKSLVSSREILKDARGGDGFIKQVAGPSPAPRWQR